MTDALFDPPPARPVEPSLCTGGLHQHRWLKFGPTGEKSGVVVEVAGDGLVSISEQAVEQLLRDAGYVLADPDSIEVGTARRLAWAKSRLLAALPGRNR